MMVVVVVVVVIIVVVVGRRRLHRDGCTSCCGINGSNYHMQIYDVT